MSQEITLAQSLRVVNGIFVFPGSNASLGGQNIKADQTNPGGGAPGYVAAISTGQGTLVDLSALTPAIAGGGWCVFVNNDPNAAANSYVTWGPDSAGNIIATGEMLSLKSPGEIAGPFRLSRSQQKIRFKASAGTINLQVFFLVP